MVPYMSGKKNRLNDLYQEKKTFTYFGFDKIDEADKDRMVKGIFNNVAPHYDIMNDLMSFGVHRLWKNSLIKRLRPNSSMELIDVGGGTGDLAIKFLQNGGKKVSIVDINEEMLRIGRDRTINFSFTKEPKWILSSAERLPFEDSTFDAYVTAFCLRNVTHLNKSLDEAIRVLKPGGRFLCLEFSELVLPQLHKIYDLYSFNILPLIGQVIAKDSDSYKYLVESIRKFPNQQEFASQIKNAGMENITFQNLSCGIASIHSAWKI